MESRQILGGRALRALMATLFVTLSVTVVGPETAAAGPSRNEATWKETWFPSGDGTMLHADLFLPAAREADERHPVILSIGPYFGSGGSGPREVTPFQEGPVMRFKDLMEEGRIFERGYAYVQVDLRGRGSSEGCYDLGGPGEQTDVKSAVEWVLSDRASESISSSTSRPPNAAEQRSVGRAR